MEFEEPKRVRTQALCFVHVIIMFPWYFHSRLLETILTVC